MNTPHPKIKGLILAGGISSRMGVDKSQITYIDKLPHERYLMGLFHQLQIETYLSKGFNYKEDSPDIIKDVIEDKGPLGAIYSAMISDRSAAWLVLACDLPLIDTALIRYLIDNRDGQKMASCYQNVDGEKLQPLMCIYEPISFPYVQSELLHGNSSPYRMLSSIDIHRVNLIDPTQATNINTPIELEQFTSKMTKPD